MKQKRKVTARRSAELKKRSERAGKRAASKPVRLRLRCAGMSSGDRKLTIDLLSTVANVLLEQRRIPRSSLRDIGGYLDSRLEMLRNAPPERWTPEQFVETVRTGSSVYQYGQWIRAREGALVFPSSHAITRGGGDVGAGRVSAADAGGGGNDARVLR